MRITTGYIETIMPSLKPTVEKKIRSDLVYKIVCPRAVRRSILAVLTNISLVASKISVNLLELLANIYETVTH